MFADGKPKLILPETLAIGELLKFANDVLEEENCLDRRFTFAGGEFFDRMKEKALYSTDVKQIKKRVEAEGLADIYNR